MEKLFLKVIDGKAVQHPSLESNMLAVENVKLNDEGEYLIPKNWYKYEYSQPITPKPNQKNRQPVYVLKEGTTDTYTAEWIFEEMTAEEKAAVKAATDKPYPSWVWDEDAFKYMPPTPEPTQGEDGKFYFWNEETLEWKQVPT